MTAETLERWLTLGLSNAILATALALLALGVSRLYRCPPLAHALWLLVLLKLLSPPLLELPAPAAMELPTFAAWPPTSVEPSPHATPPPGAPVDESAQQGFGLAEEAPGIDGEWALLPTATATHWLAPAATIAWLAGTLVILVTALARIIRFDRLLRWCQPAPVRLALAVTEVARELGLDTAPQAVVIEARLPPLLWTWGGKTRVVFPAGLLASLDDAQLRTLVAHELAHLRRRDHWLRWLELGAVALYWWLPVAWWARRELRRAEEECCDAWVQHGLNAPVREYARALLTTMDFLSGVSVKLPRTASTLGEGRFLRRRFHMILERSSRHRLPAPLRALWIAACLAILPWAASGVLGQKAEDAPIKDPAADSSDNKLEPTADSTKAQGSFEHRLSRMEERLAELMAEIRSQRDKPAGEKKMIYRVEDGSIEALDKAGGKPRWRTQLKGSPEIELQQKGDRLVIVDPEQRRKVALDPDSGNILTEEKREDESGADSLLEKANNHLRAEKRRQAKEQSRKAQEAERQAKQVAEHDYRAAVRVKDDIATLKAEREKLMAQLKELEARRAAIKEQLKQLEKQFDPNSIR